MTKTYSESEFIETFTRAGGKKHWWGYPRAFQWQNEIYVNEDAFFIDERDYKLILAHETVHLNSKKHQPTLTEKILGEDHTWFGLMSPWGLVRYLTTAGKF